MQRVIIESPFSGGDVPADVRHVFHEPSGQYEAELPSGHIGMAFTAEAATMRALRARNRAYLAECLADSLKRGEAPFASHGIYTLPGVLDDDIDAERDAGIAAGFAWGAVADRVIVYQDLGISYGMRLGIEAAHQRGTPVYYRRIR